MTITYDYRGIGPTPGHAPGLSRHDQGLGELDAPAALRRVRERYPERQRAVIGHSVGGFLAGFTPDATLIDRMVLVGAHTGYWGDYARWARPFMWIMWHAMMPAVTRTMGYFPARRLGLPEDLPAGVAYDWAARTRPDFKRNFRRRDGSVDFERFTEIRSRFEAVDADVLAATISDDPFAIPKAITRLRGLYKRCRFEELRIDATIPNTRKIGHFGFFRSAARETLWPLVINWLVTAAGQRRSAKPHQGASAVLQNK